MHAVIGSVTTISASARQKSRARLSPPTPARIPSQVTVCRARAKRWRQRPENENRAYNSSVSASRELTGACFIGSQYAPLPSRTAGIVARINLISSQKLWLSM